MRRLSAFFFAAFLALTLAACADGGAASRAGTSGPAGEHGRTPTALDPVAQSDPERRTGTEVATFAGGCFWCMETAFEGLDGVVSVTSGYAGGGEPRPSYEQVSSGTTGHAESVQIVYDPSKISYRKLLEIFWRNIDPTTPDRQFCDAGHQYRPAIFWHDATQQALAEESKRRLERSGRFERVVTAIAPLDRFWPAEAYHQDFWKKDPVRYKAYRSGCGRDRRLEELWEESPQTDHP